MPLRHLFIDMNSFFASVEQQEQPWLRGKPVAVVPVLADSTSCIAASYEAKAFGVKTGTPVWEARQRCPGIHFITGNHKRYVQMHHRIVDAVNSCIPVRTIRSVDEMVCSLIGDERKPDRAVELGLRIKAAIYSRAGDYMRCSIGAGPNELLAKMAADMKKPDGLTILSDAGLPHALHGLQLTDFPGIAKRMERRLHLHGLFTVEQFCAASAATLGLVWGSRMLGEKWHRLIRGDDMTEKPTHRHTVGHSHVLPPELRTETGAFGVLVKLAHKAAARMRKIGYWTGSVSVGVTFRDVESRKKSGWNAYGWNESSRIAHCEDTPTILRAVSKLWGKKPADGVPFKVGLVLADLRPAKNATPSLFPEERAQAELSHAMDDVNREFGASVVHFGGMFGRKNEAPTRIAFTQIPDFDRTVN
jgi:DNA polymerase-4